MSEDTRYDGVLMTMIQQRGSIDGFFDGVFGFLRRNTDFFANQKKAEEIIVNNCRINFEKFNQQAKEKLKEEQRRKEEAERKKKAKEQEQRQKELRDKELREKEKQQQDKKEEEPTAEKKEESAPEKKEEDNEPAPKGNGGRTDKYIWIQTLENLQLFVFLPGQTTKKDLKVDITHEKVSVALRGEKLIDGLWKEKINSDEQIWTIESGELDNYKGKYLHVTVDKWQNQAHWWSTPIQGHPEINTQKINPEPSKLSDLDGETRSSVEKMMFDMRQKQQGLPSSDELQKQEKLKEFMKAHPEMDFSQCKFA